MSRRNEVVSELLSSSPVRSIAALAARHSAPVYLVGGAVRDAFLGREPADIDVVVGADLDGFVAAFAAASGTRPVAIGDDFRDTHRTRWRGTQIDLAALIGAIDDDLRQRDFTVNALAVSLPDGELMDPCGGRRDLADRTLRLPSEEVLDTDPLRLLRAVRYAITLDGFALDAPTRAALGSRAARLSGVAAERVQSEWQAILAAPRWLEGLELAADLGFCRGGPFDGFDAATVSAWASAEAETAPIAGPAAPPTPVADRLAAILLAAGAHDAADDLVARRWPSTVARQAARVARWAADVATVDRQTLVDWSIEDHDAAARAARLAHATRRDDTDAVSAGVTELTTFARRATEPRWVRGADLVSWGMAPGPQLGAVLRSAEKGQVGRRWTAAEEARAWARAAARQGDTSLPSIDG